MTCKGFGKQQLWPNWGLSCNFKGLSMRSFRAYGIPTKIGTRQLLNTSLQHYCCSPLSGFYKCVQLWHSINVIYQFVWVLLGCTWHSWFRYCATSQQVADSIPNGFGISHWHNPSSHTMALGSTQPLTGTNMRSIPGL